MLLGNAHVVVTIWKALTELHHARPFTHGGRDAYHAWIFCRHIAQPLAKDIRECDFAAGRTHHP